MADPVYWGSRGFSLLEDSRGNAWSDHFTLRLGVFRDGFLPTADNVDHWQDHWLDLSTAGLDATENRYAGMVDDSLPLPAGTSPQVYFWAGDHRDLTSGPDWMLLTHPDWIWSGRTSSPALPKIWIADEAAHAILGRVSGGEVHLKSEAVRPAPVDMESWLAARLPEDADLRPDADPDGNGLTNLAEYLFGTQPGSGSPPPSPAFLHEPEGLRLSIQRNPYALSSFVLEASHDLKNWFPADAATVEERPNRIEVLAERPEGQGAVFYRFNLQPKIEK